jgi:Transmembrane secretion effector
VLYITRELNAPTSLFGAFQGAFAIGSILIGWQVSRIVAAFGEWRALAIAVSIIPVAFVVTPLIPSVVTVGVTSLLNGAAAVVWNTVSISHRQRVTPHELLGRATAVFRLVSWGGMPLGAFACGPIAQRWGLLAPYFVFAFVAALNLPLAGLLLRRSRT